MVSFSKMLFGGGRRLAMDDIILIGRLICLAHF